MLRHARFLPLVLIVALAGCGSSSSSSSSATSAASASTSGSGSGGKLVLSESEFKITPDRPSVSAGGPITITAKNTGTVTHALAVNTPAGLKRTPSIAPGASATLTVTFAKSGSYTFYCPIGSHRKLGMQGTLVVGGEGGSGGSSTSSPAEQPSKTY